MIRTTSKLIGFLYFAVWTTQVALAADNDDKSLVGRWKFAGNVRDSSPNENHGTNHGADQQASGPDGKPGTALQFDGRDDVVEVPDAAALDFGNSDEFTISVRVHTATELDDALGDIVAKYDPKRRKGFHLGFLHNVGVPSSQANYRQLTFGIDDGQLDDKWTDHGRPGNAMLIFALADFNGELYAGTCESGENAAGHVFRYDDRNSAWIDCGSPHPCNSVSSLAVHDGKRRPRRQHRALLEVPGRTGLGIARKGVPKDPLWVNR